MSSHLEIHAVIIYNDPDVCEVICNSFDDSPIRFTALNRADEALQFIDTAVRFQTPLDLILTGLALPGAATPKFAGFDILRRVRNAHDDESVAGGFRLRHLPIIVMSASSFEENRTKIFEIDSKIPYMEMPFKAKELITQVSTSLRSYRHSILQDFQRSGLAIFWRDGRFQSGHALKPRHSEGKYWSGRITTETLPRYSKLVMMCDGWLFAETAVSSFEALLNDSKTTERDFQKFFKQHPEFLDQNHDSYWSEPFIKSIADRVVIRPDFIFQKRGQRELPWTWKIVDLKQPRARLLSNKGFHPSLSSEVYHLKTQLEDYGRFFDDPRNEDLLRKKFGGVLPRPKLAGLIGRIPSGQFERFTELRENLAGVTITTYDEVLDSRREYVSWMKRVFAD